MKLLIIAGPYEADRIRKAAVSAGFETVAVEPGESLSGWITASRPDLIVMAPQIVNPDPAVALAKVRSVPRGRVPIFLVGESTDEARMKGLGDGFFVRPVSTADLVARARARLGGGDAPFERSNMGLANGAAAPPAPAPSRRRTSTGENAIPVAISDASSAEFARSSKSGASGPQVSSGPHAIKPTLKPLVAAGDASGPVSVKARPSEAGAMFVKLAESIDDTLDAEMRDVARSVGALRRDLTPGDQKTVPGGKRPPREELERTPMAPMTALAAAAALPRAEDPTLLSEGANEALEELRDDTSQKTAEVPRDAFAKMVSERARALRSGPVPPGGVPAPVESGKVADNDVAALFGRMVLQRLTGRLVLRREGVEKRIFFDRGGPVLASSSDDDDRLGEMMVRQGRLTDQQQKQGLEALATSGRRLGATLAHLGIIKLSELPLMVRRQYEEIVHSVFAWEDGEWSLGPERPPKDKNENVFVTEHPAALILEGIRRKYGASRLRHCLGGGEQIFRLPAAVGTAEVLLRLRLTHEERTMVPLFDGVRTLDEVCALSEAPDEVVCGVAWALSVLGHLERIEPRTEEAVVSGTPSNGDGAAAARDGGRDRDIDRARVLSRYALVEEGDYFQVLGVPRSATAHEVRRAHQALMREFAPAALDPVLATELAHELRAIRVVLDEAVRVLGEARLRERYQTRLPAASARR